MNILKTKNLTKKYKDKTIINNISLSVKEGEIYGFLGRNGAGKSTFINIITGIIKPTDGDFILFNGNSDNIKKRIGVLPDYSSFYDSMTAFDHLKYFSGVIGQKYNKHHIIHTLNSVGLGNDLNKKISNFSFGMKKKLGIAQAIIHNPDLIILDEPTSGVDVESSLQIRDLIIDLNNKGKTIFITSHNLNEIEEMCSKVAILKDGKIAIEGTISNIKQEYQSKSILKIKIEKLTDNKINELLEELLRQNSCKLEAEYLYVDIEKSDETPEILKKIFLKNIGIFEVSLIEPSLEEVFLEKHKMII